MVYSSSDSFTFFWRPHEENGFLGQWYESPFEVDGVRYLMAEQFMMAEKARSKIQYFFCHLTDTTSVKNLKSQNSRHLS